MTPAAEPVEAGGAGAPAGSAVRVPWARMGSVVFDCDSTLSTIEGIEHLAGESRAELRRLTREAMDGERPLESVYGRRLALVRPGRAAVEQLGRAYEAALVDDAREVIAALRSEGIVVRVVSGGLRPAVVAVARALGLGEGDVAAVDVRFDETGAYVGYDEDSPLTRSGGKREILEAWQSALPRPIMLVGDGMTDLEARPAADVFVAFGGVVARESVMRAADHVIRAASLAPVLVLALGGARPRDPKWAPVWERGYALLTGGGAVEPDNMDRRT